MALTTYLRYMLGKLRTLFQSKLPEKKILLYGLQRSGTNYLETLMQLNYPNCTFINSEVRNNIMHKHFRLYNNKQIIPEPQFDNDAIFENFEAFEQALSQKNKPDLYLVMSKDPYSWFTSYMGWSKKNNWPNRGYHYIEEYNLFYGKWMEFQAQTTKVIFVQYHDLLVDPLPQINAIAKQLQLPMKDKIRTTNKVYASRKFTTDKKDAFLNKSYLSKINAGDFEQINNLLNSALLGKMGYTKETP